MEDKDLTELRMLSDRLAAMLADPQPGLFFWKLMLGLTLLRLAAYCGIEPVSVDAYKLSERPEYKLS